MKTTSFKALAAAAIAAMSCTAHASGPDYTFAGGGAVLTFTSNSLSALNIAGLTVTASAPATFDGAQITMTSDDSRVTWDSNYDITSMIGFGGFTVTSNTTQGAQIVLSNIQLDPRSVTVYADATTSSFSTAFDSYQGKTISHLALFTGDLTGNPNILASGGDVGLSIQNLTLTSTSIPEFGNALGVPSFIQQALFPAINFGQITLEGTFTAAQVPEPSTYALMGIGLIGVMTARRRKLAH